jgi:hypothetical protein
MAATTESPRNTSVLLSEACGALSRESVTIVSGTGIVKAGTVLGKVTASGKYAHGTETAAAIALMEVDATSADAACAVVFRLAEVVSGALVWAATNDAGDKTAGLADLAAKHIIAR